MSGIAKAEGVAPTRVAFISTPTRTYAPNSSPPFGILYLAAYLRTKGHQVTVIDVARTRQDNSVTIRELMDFRPDAIAVSGIATAYRFIRGLMSDLKPAFPAIPFMVGGHITLDTVDLLLGLGFDYAVIGYGELKLEYLLEHLQGRRALETIPGVGYKEGGSVRINPGECFFKDIDDSPLPAYDLIDMEYYLTIVRENQSLDLYGKKTGKKSPPLRMMMVFGALGCTDKCSFCVHEQGYRGFRVHSTEYIIENIRHLYDTYGARVFVMGEDLFLFNDEQTVSFCEAMNRHFPDAFFELSTRANFLTERAVEALKHSNCYSTNFGFESGSNRILAILLKRMDRATNISAYRRVLTSPIIPKASFMVGTPGETEETIRDTISAIEEAGVMQAGIFFTTPYPGSRLFRWCLEKGYIQNREDYLMMVADRDANTLSINLTPYPDVIVKMMYVMVENAILKNVHRGEETVRRSTSGRFIKGFLVPMAFRSYFLLRRGLSRIFPEYGIDAIDPSLLLRPHLSLSTDGTESKPLKAAGEMPEHQAGCS